MTELIKIHANGQWELKKANDNWDVDLKNKWQNQNKTAIHNAKGQAEAGKAVPFKVSPEQSSKLSAMATQYKPEPMQQRMNEVGKPKKAKTSSRAVPATVAGRVKLG